MPFPETTERFIYGKSPLTRVISQIRFLPILKIEAEIPAQFQERIGEQFPRYQERREIPPGFPPEMQSFLSNTEFPKIHYFKSDDENWQITLAKTFIAATTTNYESWDVFKENLSMAFQACKDIYSPRKITRIGLRYVNDINRTALGIKDKAWKDLIRPSVLGINSEEKISDNIITSTTTYEMRLTDPPNSAAKIRTQWEFDEQLNDSTLRLDMDIKHEQEIEVESLEDFLNNFNSVAGRIFRWCITDELHKSMEPMPCQS